MEIRRSIVKDDSDLRLSYSLVLCALLYLFAFTRVYRNSIGYYNTAVGGIWNVIVLLFCFLSILLLIIKNNALKNEKSLIFLLLYGIFSVLFCLTKLQFTVSNIYNLLMIMAFPLCCSLFYIASKYFDILKQRKFIIFFYYLLLIFVSITNIWRLTGRLSYIMISNVYYLLALFPVILLFSKNKNLIIILTSIPVITSEKRTAFLAFFLSLIVYFLVQSIFKKNFNKRIKQFFYGLLIVFFSLVILNVLESMFNVNIISRLLNLSNDKGSGRADMYLFMLKEFDKSSFTDKLFGHGLNSSAIALVEHDDVHNDFIQILYEYGLIPFAFFMIFYFGLIGKTISSVIKRKKNSEYLVLSILIFLFLSLFSVFIVDFTYSITAAFTLGIVLNLVNYEVTL